MIYWIAIILQVYEYGAPSGSEAIDHSEEGTFQTQQYNIYCYRYL